MLVRTQREGRKAFKKYFMERLDRSENNELEGIRGRSGSVWGIEVSKDTIGYRLMSLAAMKGSGRTLGQLGQHEFQVSLHVFRISLEIQIYLVDRSTSRYRRIIGNPQCAGLKLSEYKRFS